MVASINASTSAGVVVTSDTSGSLALQTNSGVTALTIDTSQNVTCVGNITLNNGAADGAQLTLNSSGYSSWNWDNYSGRLRAYYNTTEYFTIDTSGNVGIGTSSPTTATDIVRSNTSGNDNQMPNLFVRNTSATQGNGSSTFNQAIVGVSAGNSTVSGGIRSAYDSAGSYGTGVQLYVNSTNPLQFYTNGSERMRIDSSGNLLVGTTGLPANGKLTVSGSSRLYNTGDGNAALNVDKSSSTNTSAQWFVAFTISNQTVGSGYIGANGASQAAFGSFSDSRLKENIVNLPSQLANIMALRPVEYDYIESEGGGHQIGFIAQEVQQIYPDLVGERDDGMLTLTDLNKNDARLIKAIQEQQALIQTLQTQVAQLQEKVGV